MNKRIAAWLGAVVVGLSAMLGVAAPAFAAGGDSIDTFEGSYVVQSDGSLQVTQTVDYRFGPGSGRHGIYVYAIVREPYAGDDKQDRVYSIKDISVSSTTPGVSTQYQVSEQDAKGGTSSRTRVEYIQIGSKNSTVSAAVANYTIRYTVTRAIMNNPHGDELYWDAITPEYPLIKQATLTVTTPTPSVDLNCATGATGSTQRDCTASADGTTQTITASNVGDGTGLTFSSTFEGGAVTNNTPELAPTQAVAQQRALALAAGATGVTGVLAVAGGVWFSRTRGRDKRYAGVAPGLMPAPGQADTVIRDDKPEIPVQFNPPPISVGEAGMLTDGSVDVRDTTATLVSLATQGYIKLGQPQKNVTVAQCIRADAPPLPHEQALMQGIFGSRPQPGVAVDLSESHSLESTHRAVSDDLRRELSKAGFYTHMPSSLGGGVSLGKSASRLIWLAVVVFGVTGGSGVISGMLKDASTAIWFVLPLVPLVALVIYIWLRASKGQRSAKGRAMQDQIEGFRKYIATAEASQLKFEEGEDIFSKYLPWAIMFGLAERWTKICQQLVAMGRIPDTEPDWYFGPWYGYAMFNPMSFGNSLDQAFTPAPPEPSSSGSGSGFSGFGGGSVGGGGGGGGMGSW